MTAHTGRLLSLTPQTPSSLLAPRPSSAHVLLDLACKAARSHAHGCWISRAWLLDLMRMAARSHVQGC